MVARAHRELPAANIVELALHRLAHDREHQGKCKEACVFVKCVSCAGQEISKCYIGRALTAAAVDACSLEQEQKPGTVSAVTHKKAKTAL